MRDQARAWTNALTALQALLHARDPEGMGESVFAPQDEYADVAARLLRTVTRRPAGTSGESVVIEILPTAWRELIAEILSIAPHSKEPRRRQGDPSFREPS